MNLGIENKVALVTGASKGIGLAIAQGLAAEGVRVALSARGEEELGRAVEGIRRAGGQAEAVPADVSDPAQVEALLAGVRERWGDPEILVSNAGGPPAGLPSELDEEAWRQGIELTLLSSVRLARAALPAMRRAGWGRIVNVTSLTVREPVLRLALSNALRAGVTAFAKSLSTEVAAEGVTVNGVGPGYTATERLEELFEDEAAKGRLVDSIPAKRFGTPEEVAAVAVFLCSRQAAYVTGQTIFPDGGATKSVF